MGGFLLDSAPTGRVGGVEGAGHRCFAAEYGSEYDEFGFTWVAAFCACGRALAPRRVRRAA